MINRGLKSEAVNTEAHGTASLCSRPAQAAQAHGLVTPHLLPRGQSSIPQVLVSMLGVRSSRLVYLCMLRAIPCLHTPP
jgi:hypothetical protein